MLLRTRFRHTARPCSAIARTTGHGYSRATLLVLALVMPHSVSATPVDDLVQRISQPEYTSYVQDLQNFGTRYYSTPGNAAALSYIHGAFAGFGLNVSYDPFSFSGNTYNNVVATLPGKIHPENVYIVGAHMDSTSTDPLNHAPGADDNASGMAAVLAMAKALVPYAFNATIKFIGFNAEEEGLVGSHAYATEAQLNGEHIVGMLNFDMIADGGPTSPKSVYLAGDQALVDAMARNAATYTALTTNIAYANVYGSDHYYFHSSLLPGSSSAFAIETSPGNIPSYNPNYHQPTDTVDYLDFGYASDITRIGVATVAEFAEPVPEPPAFVFFLMGIAFLAWGTPRARPVSTR